MWGKVLFSWNGACGACQHMAAAFSPSALQLPVPHQHTTHTHTQLHGGSYPSDSIRSPPPISAEPRLTITSSLLITSAKTFLWRLQLHVQTLQTVLWHKLCLRRCIDEIWSRKGRVETPPSRLQHFRLWMMVTRYVGRRKCWHNWKISSVVDFKTRAGVWV